MDVDCTDSPWGGAKLDPLVLELTEEKLPPRVEALLEDGQREVEKFFEIRRHDTKVGFFPSDYELGYRALCAVHRVDGGARRLCEWGSGLGVVVGLAVLAGFEACGIELDHGLAVTSRAFLSEHGLEAEVLEGSFVPERYTAVDALSDEDTMTILSGVGAGATDEVDVAVDDFDVVFAFPWPTEHEMFCDMFMRSAAHGAVLVTFDYSEGIRAYRKLNPPHGDDE